MPNDRQHAPLGYMSHIIIEPKPKGSVWPGRAKDGRLFVRHTSTSYEKQLQSIIEKEYKGELLEGAVYVGLRFFLKRGKTVSRKTPFVRPDIDKLARAVLDALTGIVFRDDAQVVKLHCSKSYSDEASVLIIVTQE